ncbi:MAG: hypothetical protein LBD76_04345 [Prevotellaceae bacterium]|jgi:hypothetical protein|nr:hypothetical protein [Prevotellaceae bacterium]
MEQVTPILKKNRCRQILILSVCALTLSSCYDFDSLPDKIKTTYTLAIPIVDTTVSVGDFATIKNYLALLDNIDIPENTPINMGEQAYPFYIGDYSSSQEIEWLEPQLILEPKDLPSGIKINIKIYTKNGTNEKVYFWLPDNHPVTLENTSVKLPETPQRITNIEQFRSARNIYLDISITYPAAVSSTQIVTDKINFKLGIKFAIKTDLKINL